MSGMYRVRGFVSVVLLLAILIGFAVVGGGAYVALHGGNGSNRTSPGFIAPAQAPGTMRQAGQANSAEQPNTSSLAALMQQIGCTDQSSCIAVCMKSGMTPACAELQNFSSSGMRGYTQGNQSGPASGGGVAFVGNNTPANAGALPDCPAGNALFNTFPIKAVDLTGIEPLGHMNGEHILPSQGDHVYVLTSPSMASVPVYAPGDVTLLAVAESIGINGADKGTNTVTLYFSPCKSVMFALQINTLSSQVQQKLAALTPASVQAGATVKQTSYGPLNIPLASGTLLGTIVPFNNQVGGAGDFAAADVRTSPPQFIDQGEATGMLADSYKHTVCPLDYFDSALKSSLYAQLTIKNAGANGIPACGSSMQDKAGTLQGDWYHKSGSAPSYQGINEASLLAFAHSNLDPSQGIVSAGTDLIPSAWLGTQILFQPTHTGYVNREPSEVAPDGHVYCFDGPAGAGGHGSIGHVDVRFDTATTFEADYASGACAAVPVLSASSVAYER